MILTWASVELVCLRDVAGTQTHALPDLRAHGSRQFPPRHDRVQLRRPDTVRSLTQSVVNFRVKKGKGSARTRLRSVGFRS